jgi:pimeloyl-ACP methyl ester carboxylesterase/DNA-binding CsgD family transcriptional regulator
MAIPHVRYATTSDGKSIAYSVAGAGPQLIWLPNIFSDVQRYEESRPWLSAWRERYRVAMFDGRGQGMSTRDMGPGFSLEAWETDLGAVQDALGAERAVLLGSCHSGHVAVRYAVKHPERVAALVLVSCCVRLSEWGPDALWTRLPYENWDMFLTTIMPRRIPAEQINDAIARMKSMLTQVAYTTFDRAAIDSTLEPDLSHVSAPCLVLHPRNLTMLRFDQSAELASLLPDARLLQIGGSSDQIYGDPGEMLEAVNDFLGDVLGEPTSGPRPAMPEMASEALTPREVEVLRLIASGRSNREIADELVLSVRTVERHITNLYGKISARGKADATAFALRSGVL